MEQALSREPREPREPPVRALYLTFHGLLEPLGGSHEVTILLRLAEPSHPLAVVSFERPVDFRRKDSRELLRRELARNGIHWIPLVRHRSVGFAGTTWDLVRSVTTGLALARRFHPSIVHARSHLAGASGLAIRGATQSRLLFDMRGFWPEERVELGELRSHGFFYRLAKRVELALLASADHIVVPTEDAKEVLRDREASAAMAWGSTREASITVVPSSVDVSSFESGRDEELAERYGLENALVIGNLGAFNRRYMTSEMFRFAFHLKAHRPYLRFVYLTDHEPAGIIDAARGAGLRHEDVIVARADETEIPRWLSLFRLGVFFLRPSYAAKASSFGKLGELLASGVPVVTNTGVGDMERILAGERCGFLLPGLTDRDLSAFARKALPLLEGDQVPEQTRDHCRAAAAAHFAVAEAVRRYRGIYDGLTSEPTTADPDADARQIVAELR